MKCPHCGYNVPPTKYCLACSKPLLLEVVRVHDRRRKK